MLVYVAQQNIHLQRLRLKVLKPFSSAWDAHIGGREQVQGSHRYAFVWSMNCDPDS